MKSNKGRIGNARDEPGYRSRGQNSYKTRPRCQFPDSQPQLYSYSDKEPKNGRGREGEGGLGGREDSQGERVDYVGRKGGSYDDDEDEYDGVDEDHDVEDEENNKKGEVVKEERKKD